MKYGKKFISLRSGFHYELVLVDVREECNVLLFSVSNDNGLTPGYMEWYVGKDESFPTPDLPWVAV